MLKSSPEIAADLSDTATSVRRLRDLLHQQQFSKALDESDAQLVDLPEQRDLLLLKAISERYLGRLDDALETLARLERHHPRFSRLHEERGHCHALGRHAPQAIDAFQAAVNLNYALPSSWHMLEGLYRITGQESNRVMAAAQLTTLRNLPAQVVAATALFLDGDLDDAETRIRAYLLEHGDEIESMRLLARIGIARKVFDDAELLLSGVLALAPDYVVARCEYAEVLIELHKYAEARRELDQLMRVDSNNRFYYRSLEAATLVGLGENERAVSLYRELIDEAPEDPDLHLSIAHALKTMGKRDAAIDAYRRAAVYRPQFGDAYWSLANLKTYRFTDEELARLRALQLDSTIGTVDKYHLQFALGKALEDRGEYAESFQHYERGNFLKRAESRYRAEIIENNTRLQMEVCTKEFFALRHGWGNPARDPIFIVGLPRSGSTLLEQILASHSKVEGTQELANVQQIVAALRGRDPDLDNPRYPRILATLGADDYRQWGEAYLTGAQSYRTGKPFFIDKMPNNFRHLGLIHLMLPNARIIDARREPMACCFGNLKQLFAKGQEFSYSINDIARYYCTYLELMRHWNTVLPTSILKVQHEEVVEDLEGSIHRILEFCGLNFEPQCIEFYKTKRSVRTASSEQVRQPLYRDGLDQWKRFEPWLEPLRSALGDALTSYRHD